MSAAPAGTASRPRVVWVTGASSGIGLAVAGAAADAGDALVLVARDVDVLERARHDCLARGASRVDVEALDVADDDAVRGAVARTLHSHGRIDVVVHAAGVVAYGRTEQVPAEVFAGVIRTNVLGSVTVARHVVPAMREQDAGTLLLIGSVIGHIAVPTMSPYVLSKWAVRALARQLQLENRDSGLHVVYLAPGGVDTPIYRQAANYSGFVGRPPPPVASPERVARRVWHLIEHPRRRAQVGAVNDVMRAGFSVFPGLFDLLVGPLFAIAGKDRTDPVDPHTGNVLAARPELDRLHGDQGGAVAGIVRNLRTLWPRGGERA